MIKLNLFNSKKKKHISETPGYIDSDPAKCVQCGICSYNCPIGIDVRAHAMRGLPVNDKHCLTCGECVARCPRGVLSFEKSSALDDLRAFRLSGSENNLAAMLSRRASDAEAQITRPVSSRS